MVQFLIKILIALNNSFLTHFQPVYRLSKQRCIVINLKKLTVLTFDIFMYNNPCCQY